MSLKVWLGFRQCGSREPVLKQAVLQAMHGLGWKESDINDCDLAIWWGLPPNYRKWLEKLKGKPYVIVEFPFWGRGNKHNIVNSLYKVSLNGLHPNRHFWQNCDDSRYCKYTAPQIKPWKQGGERVLIAGMGEKGCVMYGYQYGEWDVKAVSAMQRFTSREIIYRPKPNHRYLPNVTGATIDTNKHALNKALANTHLLVTHHGNSAVEALAEGVPVLCADGVGKLMGIDDFSKVETPFYPENRVEFFHQLSWWQWSYLEIKSGTPFKWMIEKGLISG